MLFVSPFAVFLKCMFFIFCSQSSVTVNMDVVGFHRPFKIPRKERRPSEGEHI